MGVTGYEVDMYRDIGKIARSLDRIADALDRIAPTPHVFDLHPELNACTCGHLREHPIHVEEE